jgi:hypothetical protein
VFVEWNFNDLERITGLWKQLLDEREEGSDKWPTGEQVVHEPHILEAELYNKSKDIQAFWIVETENPMHFVNYRMHFALYIDIKIIPITHAARTTEVWMGMTSPALRGPNDK